MDVSGGFSLAACAAIAAGLVGVPAASAETLGSDLSGTPQFPITCDNACIIFGLEGPAGPGTNPTPITAPSDGTITQVQVRSGDMIPIELVRMELVGSQYYVKSVHPLGTTNGNTMEWPVESFFEDVLVRAGEILGVRATPTGMGGTTLGGYNTPGSGGTGVIDPSPAPGDQAAVNKGGAGQMPAIRFEFLPDGGQQKKEADVYVSKSWLGGSRVGDSIDYDVRVGNNGASDATGVTLTDTYGRGLALESLRAIKSTPTGSNPLCAADKGSGPGTITCEFGTLERGARRLVQLHFKITGKASALHPDQIARGIKSNKGKNRTEYNSVAVTSTAPDDPDLSNNAAFVATEIIGYAMCGGRELLGTQGRDVLNGSKMPDLIIAMSGRDRLSGGPAADCLFGNEGNDVLTGGGGRDLLVGGPGRNVYRAADGEKDTIVCVSKRDRGTIDREDKLRGKCREPRFETG